MTTDFSNAAATLLVVALMTALTRAIPYLLFGGRKEIPETVVYLGQLLPASIMMILVVYCLRNTQLNVFPFGLPEFLSVALVIVVQWFKKNALLSIILGTACYMLLIRTIF